jgi:hypothetical protein
VVAPADVKPLHIHAFIVELMDRTSAGNAHTNYRALRTFFNWLVLEEEVDRTPMDRTKSPIVPEKPVPVVTDSAIKMLFTSCQGKDFISLRDTAIIRVLFDTAHDCPKSRISASTTSTSTCVWSTYSARVGVPAPSRSAPRRAWPFCVTCGRGRNTNRPTARNCGSSYEAC